MGTKDEKSGFWKQIGLAVFIALLAGGTSPWWYSEFFDSDQTDAQNGPPTRDEKADIDGTYLMDRYDHRIIVVTRLGEGVYQIEEASGSWPWQGTARLDGSRLSGDAVFRNSRATMAVDGTVRGDGAISVAYRFITDSEGRPSSRQDNHVWYPKE